jgi:hypothetical protein
MNVMGFSGLLERLKSQSEDLLGDKRQKWQCEKQQKEKKQEEGKRRRKCERKQKWKSSDRKERRIENIWLKLGRKSVSDFSFLAAKCVRTFVDSFLIVYSSFVFELGHKTHSIETESRFPYPPTFCF